MVYLYKMKIYLLNLLRNLSPKLFLFLKFYILKSKKSDINEHLGVLSTYASKCESIFETGVRGVVSSWALLHGLSKNSKDSKSIFLNDIVDVNIDSISKVASKLSINFKFKKMSNLDLEFDPDESFDLTFIDTLHVYGQLKRELNKFAILTNKYLILHDTTIDGEFGEVNRYNFDAEKISKETNIPINELLVGLWPAVVEFIDENPEWEILHRFTHNNGLTILKKNTRN